MPCRDDRDQDSCASDVVKIGRLQNRLDEVTQNLCYLCGTIEGEKAQFLFDDNDRLAKWWEDHRLADAKRVSAEMREFIKTSMITDVRDSNVVAMHFIATAEAEHPVSEYHKEWFNELAGILIAEYNDTKAAKKNLANSIKSKLSPAEIAHLQTHGI